MERAESLFLAPPQMGESREAERMWNPEKDQSETDKEMLEELVGYVENGGETIVEEETEPEDEDDDVTDEHEPLIFPGNPGGGGSVA